MELHYQAPAAAVIVAAILRSILSAQIRPMLPPCKGQALLVNPETRRFASGSFSSPGMSTPPKAPRPRRPPLGRDPDRELLVAALVGSTFTGSNDQAARVQDREHRAGPWRRFQAARTPVVVSLRPIAVRTPVHHRFRIPVRLRDGLGERALIVGRGSHSMRSIQQPAAGWLASKAG